MNETAGIKSIAIRRARQQDLEAIVRIFLESAAFHAELDAERYIVLTSEIIDARYRGILQHASSQDADAIVLVAESQGELAGFIEARLDHSADAMHRAMTFCHIS